MFSAIKNGIFSIFSSNSPVVEAVSAQVPDCAVQTLALAGHDVTGEYSYLLPEPASHDISHIDHSISDTNLFDSGISDTPMFDSNSFDCFSDNMFD